MHPCGSSLVPAGKFVAHYNAEIGLNKFPSSSPRRYLQTWEIADMVQKRLTQKSNSVWLGTHSRTRYNFSSGRSTQRVKLPKIYGGIFIEGSYVNCCSVLAPNLQAIFRKDILVSFSSNMASGMSLLTQSRSVEKKNNSRPVAGLLAQ